MLNLQEKLTYIQALLVMLSEGYAIRVGAPIRRHIFTVSFTARVRKYTKRSC
jgi:TRAP-type mannitol/chloroaromatic compound transport system permease small subunit